MERETKWSDEHGVEDVKASIRDAKILINKNCWDAMFGWCKAADCEVSGLGLVRNKDGIFYVYDVWLPKQTGSSATTDLDPGSIDWLMRKCHEEKKPLEDIRFWWHTHYNFNTFFSSTDVATCERLVGSSAEWTVALVLNQRGEYKGRVDIMKPMRIGVEDMPVEIESTEPDRMDVYRKQVEEQVTQRHWGGHGGYPHNFGHGRHRELENDYTGGKLWPDEKEEVLGNGDTPMDRSDVSLEEKDVQKGVLPGRAGVYIRNEQGIWTWHSYSKNQLKKIRSEKHGDGYVNIAGKNIKIKDVVGFLKKSGGK